MSYLNSKNSCLELFFKYLLSAIFILSLYSCYSVKKRIGDPEVYLYKNQAHFMDGTYFIDPYQAHGKYKLLTEIFGIESINNLDKIDFEFIDDKHLKLTYSNGFQTKSKTIEGKMKNGAFRYKYKNLPLGIPIILFFYQFKVHQIALGNDDNIIITEYEKSSAHLFFIGTSGETIINEYYFDRKLY